MPDIGQSRTDVLSEDGQSIGAVGDGPGHTQKNHDRNGNDRATPRHDIDEAAG